MIKSVNYLFARLLILLYYFHCLFSSRLRFNYNNIIRSINNTFKGSNSIHPELSRCIVLIEDKRFFSHYGVDFYAVVRSFYKIIFFKKLEGGSTIEQQLVRVITSARNISLRRKLIEMMYAAMVSNTFKKNEIVLAYITLYEFANNKSLAYLCQEEKYNIEHLTNKNIIEIVARFKYPSINRNNYLRYLKRVRTIELKAYL